MHALALMLKPLDRGWAVTLSDGRELARFTGPGAKQRATRYLARGLGTKEPANRRTSTRPAGTAAGLDRATWERAMKSLRTISRLLGLCLLTMIARLIIEGPSLLSGLVAALMLVLLLASLRLRQQGLQLAPDPAASTIESSCS